MSPADSGEKDKPTIYEGEPGESVTISGGRKIALKWTPWENGIYQAEVPSENGKTLSFDQLFVNGARQNMARYPNYDPKVRPFGGVAAGAISPERVQTWANPAGGFVHGLRQPFGAPSLQRPRHQAEAVLEGQAVRPPEGQRFDEPISCVHHCVVVCRRSGQVWNASCMCCRPVRFPS